MNEQPSDLRALLKCFATLLESHQRQLDELSGKLHAIEGAAVSRDPAFAEAQETLAAEISHFAQHPLADKDDLYAELYQQIGSARLP
jgi:hypothetical protein